MAKVVLQPFANRAAQKHYADTIESPVPLAVIQQYLSPSDYRALEDLGVHGAVPIWGVTPGENGANISKWEKVAAGDVVLFSRQKAIRSSARVLLKAQSKELAEKLWGFDALGQTWEYIYFLADVQNHHIRIEDFNEAAGYKPNNNIQGFTVLPEDKSAGILSKFDNFSQSIGTSVRPLSRLETYSREDVHRIFSPDSKFTESAGTWGLSGIVPVPDRDGDYVFFVNYSESKGAELEESISESGILRWHSQLSQDLQDKRIQHFIHHDESINSIHLFLRSAKGEQYLYLGKLKYLSHNPETQNPVWFNWEIIEWDEETKAALLIQDIAMLKDEVVEYAGVDAAVSEEDVVLVEAPPPVQGKARAERGKKFKGRKRDYAAQDKKNRDLGLRGELIVLAHEKKLLIQAGRAEVPQHTSQLQGDGTGYDILSYDTEGNEKHIEVKTTRGPIESDVFLSANEVEFSDQYADSFYLYRVYELKGRTAKFYVLKGSLKSLDLKPLEYKVANLEFHGDRE